MLNVLYLFVLVEVQVQMSRDKGSRLILSSVV